MGMKRKVLSGLQTGRLHLNEGRFPWGCSETCGNLEKGTGKSGGLAKEELALHLVLELTGDLHTFEKTVSRIFRKIKKISRNYLANTSSHDLAEQVSEAWEKCFDSKVTRFLGFGKITLIKSWNVSTAVWPQEWGERSSPVTERCLEDLQTRAAGFSTPTPAAEGPDEGPFLWILGSAWELDVEKRRNFVSCSLRGHSGKIPALSPGKFWISAKGENSATHRQAMEILLQCSSSYL